MHNLQTQSIFQIDTVQLDESTRLSTFSKNTALSVQDQSQADQGTLVALYDYAADGTYQLVYCVIDKLGSLHTFVEDDGVLPTLFLSPKQQNFVSIVPYHPDKEMEISIPIFQREQVALPKANRPFLGDFIGTTAQHAIFFHSDIWSDSKPDKMLVMDFKNGAVNKKKNVKIELPRQNKISVENDQIHLLASAGKNWHHRQIDVVGNIIQQRLIAPSQKHFMQILTLSFTQDSYILCRDKTQFFLEKISPENVSQRIDLLEFKDQIYNTWQAVKVAEQTYVIQFNTEFGNGWITIQHEQIVELFYSKGVRGYKNLLNDQVLTIEHDHIIISGINQTTDEAYAVVMYPQTEKPGEAQNFWLINRQL